MSRVKSYIFAIMAAMTAVFCSVQAWATDLDDVFVAVATDNITTNVKTLLIALIAITVLFLGYKLVKRALLSR